MSSRPLCVMCRRSPGMMPFGRDATVQMCADCLDRLASALPRLVHLFGSDSRLPFQGAGTSEVNWTVEQRLDELGDVAEHEVAPADAETYLDLAIAYREMGLHVDALGEFANAIRHGDFAFKTRAVKVLFRREVDLNRLRDALFPA